MTHCSIALCYSGVFKMFTNTSIMHKQFDVDWVLPPKIEFSNFVYVILQQVGTVYHPQSNNSQI